MSGARTPMSSRHIRRAQLLEKVASREQSLCNIAEVIDAYREQYADFGPTFAAEKLCERDGLDVDHDALRRWLISEGLWTTKRRRRIYRSRRERRHQFSEMVQFDGSHHEWFEQRGEKCCLMNMVDDATGTTLSFRCEQETTIAAMKLLWAWIERYGIPRAKGRVERIHAVYQDRLVKELRLAGISDLETANTFLRDGYLEKVNAKFAKPPIDSNDAHVPLLPHQSLADILCFKELRVVAKDYVVQFENGLFQIQRRKRRRLMSPGTKIEVHKWLDDSLHFFTPDGHRLLVKKIVARPKKNAEEEPVKTFV